MADVTVRIFEGDTEIATELICSPITAAEAKLHLIDTNAHWVGKMTEAESSAGIVGQYQLIPGKTYHLRLQQNPAGRRVNVPLTVLWRALTMAEIGEDGILRLPPTKLLGLHLSKGEVYIRQAYIELWDDIMAAIESGHRRHLVTGTPGIGKTMWLFYVLWCLAKGDGNTVVLEAASLQFRVLFRGDVAYKGSATERFTTELQSRDTYYLVDAAAPKLVAARTILTCLPNREIFKHYQAMGAPQTWFLEVWSLEELIEARTIYELEELDVIMLWDKWNGIARYVLLYAHDDSQQEELDRALIQKVAYAAMSAAQGFTMTEEVCDHIIQWQVLPGRRDYELVIGSEYMASRIKEDVDVNTLAAAAASMTGYESSPLADFFGKIGHTQLIRGGRFEVMNLSTGDQSWVSFPRCSEVRMLNKGEKVDSANESIYWRPNSVDFPSIDSAKAPNLFFNITWTDAHPISVEGAENALEAIAGEDAELHFMVPAHTFHKFKKQEFVMGKGQPVDSARIAALQAKIAQYALKLNTRRVMRTTSACWTRLLPNYHRFK